MTADQQAWRIAQIRKRFSGIREGLLGLLQRVGEGNAAVFVSEQECAEVLWLCDEIERLHAQYDLACQTLARTQRPVVALRDAKYREPCHEVSKLRDDGTFARWCYKHHHWLNDAPPQKTVCDEL